MLFCWIFILGLWGATPTVVHAESPTFSSFLQTEEAAGRLDRETALMYQVYALFDPDRLPYNLQEILRGSPPMEEGTLALREIHRYWQDWSPAFRAAVSPYFLFRSDDGFLKGQSIPSGSSSDLENPPPLKKSLLTGDHRMAYWAQTANFNFEWGEEINWLSTAAACGVSFADSIFGQDPCPPIPDVIKRWAEYFETSWLGIIGVMGYREPDYARTGLIDVFIANTGCNAEKWCTLAFNIAGLTSTYCDSAFQWCTARDASYILMNRNFQVNTTASHEFFHVLQFAYDSVGQWYNQDIWWLEATATWMEDQVFDATNDYYGDIHRWVQNPEISLRSVNNSHAYGSSLFVFYLSETYGREIVREIWDYPIGRIGGMEIINDVLRASHGSDLYTDFKRFTAKNAVMDYSEGSGYGSVTRLVNHLTYPVAATVPSGTDSPDLEGWGSHYLFFVPPDQADNVLALTFNGQDQLPWGVMVVALQKGGGYRTSEMSLQPDASGCLSMNGFGSEVEGVYMIPSILASSTVTRPSYSYSADVGGSCQQVLPQETGTGNNNSSAGSDKRCFIATAAYGSFEAPYVNLLREFRDRYLMPSPWGHSLVETYYRMSPPIAEYIAVHPFAAFMTRLLLFPIIVIVALLLVLPV